MYRVINQDVEINGKKRRVGEELREGEFRPGNPDRDPKQNPSVDPEQVELSELDSLLSTGHVELVS